MFEFNLNIQLSCVSMVVIIVDILFYITIYTICNDHDVLDT